MLTCSASAPVMHPCHECGLAVWWPETSTSNITQCRGMLWLYLCSVMFHYISFPLFPRNHCKAIKVSHHFDNRCLWLAPRAMWLRMMMVMPEGSVIVSGTYCQGEFHTWRYAWWRWSRTLISGYKQSVDIWLQVICNSQNATIVFSRLQVYGRMVQLVTPDVRIRPSGWPQIDLACCIDHQWWSLQSTVCPMSRTTNQQPGWYKLS